MRPSSLLPLIALLIASPLGCADELITPPIEPPIADGKTDIGARVPVLGALGLGEEAAVTGTFSEDLEFHGYTLEVRDDARIFLGITRLGTSRNLNTALFVYGPQRESGAWGTTAVAWDDDSGWGRQSRLPELTLAEGGTYLIVVGTHDGRGRGNYRLEARCLDADCAPIEPEPEPVLGCHPAIAGAIEACVRETMDDWSFDPYETSTLEVLAACATAEVAGPARAALCDGPDAPAALCGLDDATFAGEHLRDCRVELLGAHYAESCVFGTHYGDLFNHPDAVIIVSEQLLTVDSALTALDEAQVIEAVLASAFDDLEDVETAFDWVDYGEINRLDLWDASNRQAFTAYEYGAGDNSFGVIFFAGTTERATTINDGDLYGCTVTWGQEHRRCEDDAHCAEGLRCNGQGRPGGPGRCLDPRGDDDLPYIDACFTDADCGVTSGLVCAGAVHGWEGMCLPAWMRGRFKQNYDLAIPDGDAAGLEVELEVFGLATVAMDIHIDLHIAHPRISDLHVTLVNMDETEAIIFEGERDGRELYLRGAPVGGIPGDELVNGTWRLKVVDSVTGEAGRLVSCALTITSRWD